LLIHVPPRKSADGPGSEFLRKGSLLSTGPGINFCFLNVSLLVAVIVFCFSRGWSEMGILLGGWEDFWGGGAGTQNTDSTLMLWWCCGFALFLLHQRNRDLSSGNFARNAAATKLAKKYVAENISLFTSSFLGLLFCLILFILCYFVFVLL